MTLLPLLWTVFMFKNIRLITDNKSINSILIEPSGEMPIVDGVFFSEGSPFNQGTFYTWTQDEAVAAMEKAETQVGQLNTEGVKLGDTMTYSKTVENILSHIFKD